MENIGIPLSTIVIVGVIVVPLVAALAKNYIFSIIPDAARNRIAEQIYKVWNLLLIAAVPLLVAFVLVEYVWHPILFLGDPNCRPVLNSLKCADGNNHEGR
jgi:hypothetical protein